MKKRSIWWWAWCVGLGVATLRCSDPDKPPVAESTRVLDGGGGDEASSDAGGTDADKTVDDAAAPPVDAGPPGYSTSRTLLDFGQVGCGKTAPPVSFSLNNTGSSEFKWTGRLLAGTTSRFTVVPASGTLAPGASEAIAVEMGTVPFPGSTTAGFYDDVLTIAATGASGARKESDIPIKLTGKGAIVRYSPTSVVFGAVPLNQRSTATFDIINDGNAEVELNLVGQNPRFEMTPLGPVIIAAGKSQTRSVTFNAVDVNAQADEIMLTSSNPANSLCAPLPAQGLSVSGVGSNGSVSISPASISFGTNGRVDCGTQANAQTVTIENTGNASFSWTAKLSSGGSYYTISPTSGTVQAMQTAMMQVVPKPIPATSAVTTDLYAGTIEITTTAVNDPVHIIGLHQTARGFILSSSAGTALDFGGVKISTTANKSFSLTNNGNVSVGVALAVSGAPFVVSAPNITLGPSETAAPTISFTPPGSATYTDSLVVSAPFPASGGPAQCAPLPPNTKLTGSGSTTVSVSPSSLGFGLVDCGKTANYQTVTLTNTGPAMTFTPVLGKDASSPYSLANDDTSAAVAVGTAIPVAAGAVYKLRVIPKKIVPPAPTGANAFGDTLTLTTTSSGDAPKIVQLNMTARGAFLSLSPASIAKTDNTCDHTTFVNFQVINSGNLAGDYTVAVVPRPEVQYDAFKINLSGGSLYGGQSQPGVLELRTPPGAAPPQPPMNQYLGDLVLTPDLATTILCSDAQPKSPIALDSTCIR